MVTLVACSAAALLVTSSNKLHGTHIYIYISEVGGFHQNASCCWGSAAFMVSIWVEHRLLAMRENLPMNG